MIEIIIPAEEGHTTHPLSELADFIDENYYSHGIYDWQEEVVEPLKQFGFRNDGIELHFEGSHVSTYARSAKEMRKEGKNNFKGPQLNPDVPDNMYLIGGYELVRALMRLLVPRDTAIVGDRYHGRGFEFRANVAQLRELFPNNERSAEG